MRRSKPYCNCTYGCSILEELDCLCNLTWLQVPPHATSSDKDTNLESVRKDQERATVCGHHMQKHLLFKGLSLLHLFDLHQSRWTVTMKCSLDFFEQCVATRLKEKLGEVKLWVKQIAPSFLLDGYNIEESAVRETILVLEWAEVIQSSYSSRINVLPAYCILCMHVLFKANEFSGWVCVPANTCSVRLRWISTALVVMLVLD